MLLRNDLLLCRGLFGLLVAVLCSIGCGSGSKSETLTGSADSSPTPVAGLRTGAMIWGTIYERYHVQCNLSAQSYLITSSLDLTISVNSTSNQVAPIERMSIVATSAHYGKDSFSVEILKPQDQNMQIMQSDGMTSITIHGLYGTGTRAKRLLDPGLYTIEICIGINSNECVTLADRMNFQVLRMPKH